MYVSHVNITTDTSRAYHPPFDIQSVSIGAAFTGVEVLTGVNANTFAVVMTALEFPVSTPSLEEFAR